MSTTDFTTTLLVDQTPKEVFDAINNVRGWWSEEIEGSTDKLHETFNYHFEDIHRCSIKITEIVPAKKVVWHILDNYFKPGIFKGASDNLQSNDAGFDDRIEWTDTKIIFEISEKDNKTQIRFTHQGLVPEYECYETCRNSWNYYMQQSLYSLISTGKGKPNSTGAPMTADEENFHSAASKA